MGRHNTDQDWLEVVKKYNTPDFRKSIWQLVNSFISYVIIWYLMYLSLDISYWLTLGLSVLAAAFLVRLFIIFHDCGHGSFFRSKKLNRVVGTIIGTLVFTPYDRWHSTHAVHHAFLCYRPYSFNGLEVFSYDPASRNLFFNGRRGLALLCSAPVSRCYMDQEGGLGL